MGTAVVHRSVQSSELSRNPAAVFAAAEEGPVDITRRDGEDLVLAKASVVSDERRAVGLAADIVVAWVEADGGPLTDRVSRMFPWAEFLSPAGRERFAGEMLTVTRACAAVGRFDRLLTVFEAWRSSAEAIATGYTPDDELDWLDSPVKVSDPRHAG